MLDALFTTLQGLAGAGSLTLDRNTANIPDCFATILTLLGRNSLVFPSTTTNSVTQPNGLDVVVVTAVATFFIGDPVDTQPTLKVVFDAQSGSVTCTITSTMASITPAKVVTAGLLPTLTGFSDLLPSLNLGSTKLCVKTGAASDQADANVCAAGTDTVLTLTATSNVNYDIAASIGLSLASVGMTLTRTYDATTSTVTPSFTFGGNLTIAGSGIAANVTVPLPVDGSPSADAWRLQLDGQNINLGNALTALDTFLGAGAPGFGTMLPAGLADVGGFSFTNILFEFVPVLNAVPVVNTVALTIGAAGPWTYLDQFQLNTITATVTVSQPLSNTDRSFQIDVNATMTIGGLTFRMAIGCDWGEDWTIAISMDDDTTPLQSMAVLPGGPSIDALRLPNRLTSAVPIVLEDVSLTYNVGARRVTEFNLALRSEQHWVILPAFAGWPAVEWLGVNVVGFNLAITNPFSSTRRVTAKLYGTLRLLDLADIDFEILRTPSQWHLAASMNTEFTVQDLIDKITDPAGPRDSWVSAFGAIKIISLEATYDTPGGNGLDGGFTFSGEVDVDWTVALPNAPDVSVTVKTIRVSVQSLTLPGGNRSRSFAVVGTVRLFNSLNVQLSFEYNNGPYRIGISTHHLSGQYDSATTAFSISLTNIKLGDLIRKVADLIGVRDVGLDGGWAFIQDINLPTTTLKIYLKDLNLKYEARFDFTPNLDLGFITIVSVAVQYTTTNQFRVLVDVKPFGSQNTTSFTLRPGEQGNSGVPGTAAKVFELQTLALGQRLTFADQTAVRNVSDALARITSAFDVPAGDLHPLCANDKLKYDASAGIIFGTDLSLLGALHLLLVFSDRSVAGVRLEVNSTRLRFLNGLGFEILYKKVTESIGVYQIELRLPDAIRQIDVGQVSITIPIIALDLYTNGNFRVDLGFPKNNDFSRSFTLQVLPFLGSGGFYFAMLEGATASRLPDDFDRSTGVFKPVLEFGIGLSLGVGKIINKGIFNAGLSLTFEGILEGVLAFFNSNTSAQENEMYYWMRGTFAVVGRIQGSVSFAVINANVSIVAYARIGVTLESRKPIELFFEAGVEVNLTVQIGIGWLSTDINCSFSMTIRESFLIDAKPLGNGPWSTGRAHLLPEAHGGEAPAARVAVAHDIPRPDWAPIKWTNPGELVLEFRPDFTVAGPAAGPVATHYVGMLFLRSVSDAERTADMLAGTDSMSDFELFADAMLLWGLNSVRGNGELSGDETINETLLGPAVGLEELEDLYDELTDAAGGAAPFTSDEVIEFLTGYFSVVIQPLAINKAPGHPDENKSPYYRPTMAVFPMIPELSISADWVLDTYDAVFKEVCRVPRDYRNEIREHFAQMAVQFQNTLETEANPDMEFPADVTETSIAEMVFEDYFLMIMRVVVNAAIDLLRGYTQPGDKVTSIAALKTKYGVSTTETVKANRRTPLKVGAVLNVSGLYATALDLDTIGSLLVRAGADVTFEMVDELASIHADRPGFLKGGATFIYDGEPITIGASETLTQLGARLEPWASPGEFAWIISDLGVLAASTSLYVPLAAQHAITVAADDTLAKVAARMLTFGSTGNADFVGEMATLNADVPGVLREGTIVFGSQEPYQVAPGDTLRIVAAGAFYESVAALAAAIKDEAATVAPGIRLVVPPLTAAAAMNGQDAPTLVSMAMARGLDPTELGQLNVAVTPLFDSTSTVQAPNVATIALSELRTEMYKRKVLVQVSGITSCFAQPGLRLPMPSGWAPGQNDFWMLPTDTEPLYWLTGQQFELPVFNDPVTPAPSFVVWLDVPQNAVGWYTLRPHPFELTPDPNKPVSVPFDAAAMTYLDSLATAPFTTEIDWIRSLPKFRLEDSRLPLTKPVEIQMPEQLSFGNGGGTVPSNVVPTLWSFSEVLRRSIGTTSGLAFALNITRVTAGAEEMVDTVARYTWATAIKVRVRIARKPDAGIVPMTYDIDGADPEGMLSLERILADNGADIRNVHILYRGGGDSGTAAYRSAGTGGVSALILRSNLSTLSNPQASKGLDPKSVPSPVTNYFNSPDYRRATLRLLWQGSIVRSGGYHLYYRENTPGRGLPDDVFDADGSTEITVLVSYNGTTVPRYANRVIIGDAIDPTWGIVATVQPNNAAYAASQVKVLMIPPGHAGFQLYRHLRTIAFNGPTATDTVHSLYSLLSYRVLGVPGQQGFAESIEALPKGPGRQLIPDPTFAPPPNSAPYEVMIPVAPLALDPIPAGMRATTNAPYVESPYRNIGATMIVRTDWRDVFGNSTMSGWAPVSAQTGFPPPQPLKDVPVFIGYTDRLVGLGRWPSTRSGYKLGGIGPDGKQRAIIRLELDNRRYTAGPDGPISATTKRSYLLADLDVYRTAYYQLICSDVSVKATASWTAPDADISKASLVGYVADVIDYLAAGAVAVPAPSVELDFSAALTVTDPIFQVWVSMKISRTAPLDPDVADVTAIREIVDGVEPLLDPAPIGQADSEEKMLRRFAAAFEGVFTTLKLATGLSRIDDGQGSSRTRLWAVSIGQQGTISCTIDAAQNFFFAPAPLAQAPASGTVQVDAYVTGNGLAGNPEWKQYDAVDVDDWARRLIGAIDTVLLPQYAMPGYLLDLGRAAAGPAPADGIVDGYIKRIIAAKESLANTIAGTVTSIHNEAGGDRDAAADLLLQRMLVRLSAAYEFDAVVQLGATITSSYAANGAPKLYGEPSGRVMRGDVGIDDIDTTAGAQPEFTTSTARIPMANGNTYLTYLFSSQQGEPERLMDTRMKFTATAIEHQIDSIVGVAGYQASSWLTFIRPIVFPSVGQNAQPEFAVKVPILNRALPAVPTLLEQDMATNVASNPGVDLTLAQTRGWTYDYVYDRVSLGTYDVIFTAPRFNVHPNEMPKPGGIDEPDLFATLAEFDYIWDLLQKDLFEALPNVRQSGPATDDTRAEVALRVFTELVERAALAWMAWGCYYGVYVPTYETNERYRYVISEDEEEVTIEGVTGICHVITIRLCDGTPDVELPWVLIDGFTPVVLSSTPTACRFCYGYIDPVTQQPTLLQTADALTIRNRRVMFENLNILAQQNAWGGVYAARNMNLFQGDAACNAGAPRHTNPAFVYRTPMVRFGSLLTPLIEYDRPILIRDLGPNPGVRTIGEHVSAMFTAFFEGLWQQNDPAICRRIMATCRYDYQLDSASVAADPVVVTLPIHMAPPFEFVIPYDEGELPDDTFTYAATDSITTWFNKRYPERGHGVLVFDISVYSSLSASDKLPVYRISNLQLSLNDVSDLQEPPVDPPDGITICPAWVGNPGA
ncbi:MAG: hypothetical protein JST22_16105 [Bacteroidetes bacterium]|nr:hypothetical protein [Bacteroidota bacterium]